MTDPDRYDLDLLEPLGAVAPPTPAVLSRVADNLHARYLQDAKTSRDGAARLTRHRARMALPVAAAATAMTAIVAVGLAGATHSGHQNGRVVSGTISPTAADLRDAILTALSDTASSISYTHSVFMTGGQETRVIDVWTSPFEGSPGQLQTRREVVSAGGQPVRDVEMIYALPSPDAPVPANCNGQIYSPKPPPIRAQSGGTEATDGRLIDVQYDSRSWSDQPDTCIPVIQLADAQQIRSDIASGGWTVVGHDDIDGQPAVELNLAGSAGPASADLLWVNAQTFLPIQASAKKAGAPRGDSFVTTYRFLSDTPDNQQNLTTPIPAGFTQTATPPVLPNAGS
jgi:hypothetical protein